MRTSGAPILAFGSVLKLNAIHLLSNKAAPDFTLVSDDFDALSLRCNARRTYEKALLSSDLRSSDLRQARRVLTHINVGPARPNITCI